MKFTRTQVDTLSGAIRSALDNLPKMAAYRIAVEEVAQAIAAELPREFNRKEFVANCVDVD